MKSLAKLPLLRGIFLGLALTTAFAAAGAQGPPPGHDHDHGGWDDHHDDRRGPQGHPDYHFRGEDRDHLRGHYDRDIRQWQRRPDRRPRFYAGMHVPPSYRFQPVPRSYYRTLPPPPPGYTFGYYGGYVVAYDPTTRVIADVLDLVDTAVH